MNHPKELKTVTCYFCGWDFDDRECSNADKFTNNDGGNICQACLNIKNEAIEKNKLKV